MDLRNPYEGTKYPQAKTLTQKLIKAVSELQKPILKYTVVLYSRNNIANCNVQNMGDRARKEWAVTPGRHWSSMWGRGIQIEKKYSRKTTGGAVGHSETQELS